MKKSVNACRNCRKQLTLAEDNLRMDECSECHYHSLGGTRTIDEYNKWLRGEK